MRRIAPLLACALLAAGCGEEGKLRGIAARSIASDGRCSFTGASYDGPASFNCLYLIGGTRMQVARALAQRLEEQGFAVGCQPEIERVQLQGYSRTVRVIAFVTPRKTAYDAEGFRVRPPYPPIPRGSVLVKLDLDVHDATGLDEDVVASAAPCGSPNAEPRTLPDCVRAWNVPGNARLHRSLAAARPRRLAAVGTEPIERRNACTFAFTSGARTLTIAGYWRSAGLVWTTHAFSVGSWSRWFDDDHVPNVLVAPDGRLRLRSRR